jgi:hypothetical protein
LIYHPTLLKLEESALWSFREFFARELTGSQSFNRALGNVFKTTFTMLADIGLTGDSLLHSSLSGASERLFSVGAS